MNREIAPMTTRMKEEILRVMRKQWVQRYNFFSASYIAMECHISRSYASKLLKELCNDDLCFQTYAYGPYSLTAEGTSNG